jgi:hypothetical protein
MMELAFLIVELLVAGPKSREMTTLPSADSGGLVHSKDADH